MLNGTIQDAPSAMRYRRRATSAVAVLLTAGLVVLGVVLPTTASADTRPDPGTPATVTADALPTVQVNGVVWQMVTIGNTVYATGSFDSARPPGAADGTNTTPRANLIAFDIRTGQMTGFDHALNAQGRTITASPDGSRIYVGGDFTTVDGIAHAHIAAFDVATGALINSFNPSTSNSVYTLAATDSVVYAGGAFLSAGGQDRTRLAAFDASDGSLTAWAPTANHNVRGMYVDPTGTRVVFGGQFSEVNGVSAIALASVDLSGGDTKTWQFGITNAGDSGGVYSLKSDGVRAYANTYGFEVGNIEGTVAFNPTTLDLVWMNDCHGDPYDTYSTGTLVYVASHTHDCETSGEFPDQSPRVWKRAIVMTTAVTGILKATTQLPRYGSWEGRPHPSVLDWFPTIPAGTYTGQYQGTWSVTGTGPYVAYGGEFTSVNGTAQQGLVRFATSDIAPNKRGPELSAGQMRPNAVSTAAGQVTVTWPQSWDMDNETLSYALYRNGRSQPIQTWTAKTQWWNTQLMRYTDTGLSPGDTASYHVTVSDPFGNTVTSSDSDTVTVAASSSAYLGAVMADSPQQYWRLGESSGSTAYDYAGTTNLAESSGVARGTAGAVTGDSAVTVDGTANGLLQMPGTVSLPADGFSVEAWVRTTSTAGGTIAQEIDSATAGQPIPNRTLYVDADGRLTFGVSGITFAAGAPAVVFQTIRSTTPVNDGSWHHVVASVGAGGGVLYVDGAQVASDATLTTANPYLGAAQWSFGSGALAGWPNAPTSSSLAGDLDEVALYARPLSSGQVAQHYATGTGTATNASPAASFTATPAGLGVAVDGSASSDSDGTIASYDWNWGDGTADGSGATANHTYAVFGTYTVTLTVTDNGGATATTTRRVTVTTPPANASPAASFTATPAGLGVAVDGSASSDSDGTIASYDWNWGDGTADGSGATANHSYATAGTYTVTLTVTDNGGATGVATHDVTVAAAAGPIAQDSFNRSVTGGLGTADVGGAWTSSAGASRQSVSAGVATFALPSAGNNTGSYLGEVSQTSADITLSYSLSSMPTGSGTYVYVVGRRVSDGQEYRVRVRVEPTGAVDLTLSRLSGGSEAFPGGEDTVPGLTYTSGRTLNVRVQVTGTAPTQINAKVWLAGTDEPADWQFTRTDTTAALQAPGAVGLRAHRPSNTTAATSVRFTAFRVTGDGGGAPVNTAPEASFTVVPNGLGVSVDASASTDPDGTIASYDWNWGDGTPNGSGVNATHTYASAGSYTISLTVTDNGGAPAGATRAVTVAADDTAPFASDAFNRTVTGGLGTADVGGTWTTSAGASRLSVTPGVATFALPSAGNNTGAYLDVSRTSADVTTSFSLSSMPTGSGTYLYVVGRRVSDSQEYRVRVRVEPTGAVDLTLSRLSGGTEAFPGGEITIPGLTYTPGSTLNVRVQVDGTGTTQIRARVWLAGTAEPGTWQMERTDTTAALQAPGGVGLRAHRPSNTTAATTLRVTAFAARPVA